MATQGELSPKENLTPTADTRRLLWRPCRAFRNTASAEGARRLARARKDGLVVAEFQERRRATRIAVSGRLGGRARAILDVRILDISLTGARIEHLSPLPPGSPCTFALPPAMGSLVVSARVVRSSVVGSQQTPGGKRLLRYESGIMFVGLKEEQQAALEKALEKLTPGGGLGVGQLFL